MSKSLSHATTVGGNLREGDLIFPDPCLSFPTILFMFLWFFSCAIPLLPLKYFPAMFYPCKS